MRALAINTLINEAVKIFIENEENIDGTFDKSLMSISKFKAQMDGIIEISIEKVYKSKEVIEKELTGSQGFKFSFFGRRLQIQL